MADGDKGGAAGVVDEKTFSIPEPVAESAPELKTREQLKDEGYSPGEILMAEAAGKVTDKVAEKAKEAPAAGEDVKDGADDDADDKGGAAGAAKGDGDEDKAWILSPEDEAKLKAALGPNHKVTGTYYRARKENRKRQAAVAKLNESLVVLGQERTEKAALQAKLDKAEAALAARAGKSGDEDDPLEALLRDGEGKKTGKDKLMSEADLEVREKKAEDEKAEKQRQSVAQAERLNSRLNTFIAEAQERFPDYDEVTRKGEEVIRAAKAGEEELVKLFGGDDDIAEVARTRVSEFVKATVGALSWQEGNPTPAEMFYRIGQLLLKRGKPSGAKPEDALPGKKNGDDVDRVVRNAERRPSAGVGGGGGPKLMAEKDLTVEQYLALPKHEQDRVSDATRKRLLQS